MFNLFKKKYKPFSNLTSLAWVDREAGNWFWPSISVEVKSVADNRSLWNFNIAYRLNQDNKIILRKTEKFCSFINQQPYFNRVNHSSYSAFINHI